MFLPVLSARIGTHSQTRCLELRRAVRRTQRHWEFRRHSRTLAQPGGLSLEADEASSSAWERQGSSRAGGLRAALHQPK